MPIDLGLELTIYPLDKYRTVQFTNIYNTARAPFQFIDEVGINLTSYENFKFTVLLLNQQVHFQTIETVLTGTGSADFT